MNKTNISEINNKANTSTLNNIILLISVLMLVVMTIFGLFFEKYTFVRSFALGVIGSIFYLRMQVMFVSSIAKRDLISLLTLMISGGRILIILAVLLVAIKRVDLFNLYFVISGLIGVHLVSMSVFTYNIMTDYLYDKKKLIIS
jgi:heme/copper-type cytochrome/quinol oxidase subunit 3